MGRAKAIMIQGTASNVGKSLITLALCRILSKKGYKVSPFKAQNMSLNSVGVDGKEISTAQYLQCLACGAEPKPEVNPILLKPCGSGKSDVILLGEPFKKMSIEEYYRNREFLFKIVKESLKKLIKENDVVVIEGAGSPAEINLKKYDIVNMRVAKLAGASVFLVADIDRGGAFASIVGTMELLEEDERDLIKGFILNKFRGDPSLLKDGIEYLERRYKKRVLGVVPYIENRIYEEDSLSLINKGISNKKIKIRVIKLKYISNFTEFKIFEGFDFKYAKKTEELENVDLVIVPGTKNAIKDLEFMKKEGFFDKIKEIDANIVGICGGYQILGKKLIDRGIEDGYKTVEGASLLDAKTVYLNKKRKNFLKGRVVGIDKLKGIEIKGYEIRHGYTIAKNPFSIVEMINNKKTFEFDGSVNKNVFGTYFHGIFNNINFTKNYLELITGEEVKIGSIDIMEEIEKFSKEVERHMDVDYILSTVKLP